MGQFLYYIVSTLLSILVWIIIINAILSWLVAFDVINLRHPVARRRVRCYRADMPIRTGAMTRSTEPRP